MGEEEGFYFPHAVVFHPIEPLSQWTIPEKKQTGEGGSRKNFFENPLEFLGFSFTPENSKQNKTSPVETPQNCVTLHRNFKT